MIVGIDQKADLATIDYRAGVALLIDKPLEWTSHDVVNKLRWLIRKHYGVRKFKIGHAGTLDPLASGLLILCAGKWTKRMTDFQGLEKEYTGTITLGATRPSFDMETEIDATFSIEHLDEEKVNAVIPQFTGDIMQMPPIYSAKQVNGQRAYDRARAGKEVKLAACPIHIASLAFEKVEMPTIDFRTRCSKGTYIRSLAHDIGGALDTGGYLSALRRTAIGEHRVENALQISDFEAALRPSSPV